MPDGPEKTGFKLLLDRFGKLNKVRNDIVHGTYYLDNPVGRILIKPGSENKPMRNFHQIRASELEKHIEAVNLLSLQLSFVNEVNPRDVMPTRST